eukprot:496651_1
MLKGIRVLDFTRLLPGPYATQILADLGAEVIKIEEPISGDYTRNSTVRTVDGNSYGFHALNRGKKSVSLNLKKQSDKIKCDKLIATSDVVIESFRPGVMKKLGFDPKQLLQKYPSLIICSISGYGQTGPNHMRAGHDINYISKAGLTALMKTPTLPPAQIADICGGSFPAALQIIAALYYRQNNGNKGNIIDVSMTDCSYALGIYPQTMVQNTREKMSGGKFYLCGAVPCYNIYECKDGFISVGALEPKFWRSCCLEILNAKHLISKGLVMGKLCEKVKGQVTEIFKSKTCKEWEPIIAKSDCCVEVIPLVENVQNDPQLIARDLNIKVNVRNKKKNKSQIITVPKSPLNMLYGVEFQNKPAPAKIGEHNDEILSKL